MFSHTAMKPSSENYEGTYVCERVEMLRLDVIVRLWFDSLQ